MYYLYMWVWIGFGRMMRFLIYIFSGRTGQNCRGPHRGENIILTENTPSVMLGAGVMFTLSNPPILSLSVHHPLTSNDLTDLTAHLQTKLQEILQLSSGELLMAPVGKANQYK